MANVDEENTPGPARGGSATAHERGGGIITRPRVSDDEHVDPEEYAKLLDIYDSSFRNNEAGEVVKGTVLKVTRYRGAGGVWGGGAATTARAIARKDVTRSG